MKHRFVFSRSPHPLLAVALLFACHPALGQKTTNTSLNVSGTSVINVALSLSGTGQGTLNPFGAAALTLAGTLPADASGNPTGPAQVTLTFSFSRSDSFNVSVSFPDGPSVTVSGPISGGVGAYSGATGSVTFTAVKGAAIGKFGQAYTITGSGSITVASKNTAVSLTNGSFAGVVSPVGTISANATGTLAPFGSVTVSAILTSSDLVAAQGTAVFKLNSNDSVTTFFSIADLQPKSYSFAGTVTGGTGAFAGATGSMNLNLTSSQSNFTLTGSGSITQPAAGTQTPSITSITTAGSGAAYIAQNTWIEIKGSNLTPPTTPAGGVFWSKAPEFASGRMPTQLNGMSVTVNGKPAYVYWFCSAATTPACAADQINVLTPLDSTVGPALVVVTNGTVSSAPFVANLQPVSPSFLLFNAKGYTVATHADFSLLGPTSLFPGLSTPASTGETIVLYAVGFGLPITSLVDGSANQSGSLPAQPTCVVGTTPAAVTAVLASPGLYQLALTVPATGVSGDNPITCVYNGSPTPVGDLISVR